MIKKIPCVSWIYTDAEGLGSGPRIGQDFQRGRGWVGTLEFSRSLLECKTSVNAFLKKTSQEWQTLNYFLWDWDHAVIHSITFRVSTLFQVLEIQKGKQIILIYYDIF